MLGIADPRLRDKIQKFSRESGSLAAITIIGHNTQHYLPMGATALLPPKKLAITAHENSPENVFPKLQDSFIKSQEDTNYSGVFKSRRPIKKACNTKKYIIFVDSYILAS